MDHEVLVKEFRKVVSHLRKTVDGIELMILASPYEDSQNDWEFVISAREYDVRGHYEAIGEVIAILRRTLSEDVWFRAYRVQVLRTDDPFVQTFKRRYYYLKSGAEVPPTTIAGREIGKAIVFETRAKKKAA